MFKLTKENIAEIKHVREAVATLARMQNRLYQQLLKDLDIKEEHKAEGYLFDLIHNPSDNPDEDIELLEKKMNECVLA
jgi:hypothetical protein